MYSKNSLKLRLLLLETKFKCFKMGSNQRPQSFQPCALPTELLKQNNPYKRSILHIY